MLDLAKELEALSYLPEGIDSAGLEAHWVRLLDAWDNAPSDPEGYAECFHELALRQWHSYERVSEAIERRIAIWISRVWAVHNEHLFEHCTGIIGSLGLDSCLGLIRAAIHDSSLPPDERRDLQRELEGWGDPPLDPWRGMR
jgi:hypothetical protein